MTEGSSYFRVLRPTNYFNFSSKYEEEAMSAIIGLGSAAAGAAVSLVWALLGLIII